MPPFEDHCRSQTPLARRPSLRLPRGLARCRSPFAFRRFKCRYYLLVVLLTPPVLAGEPAAPLDVRPQPWQRRAEPILSARTSRQSWNQVVCYAPHVIRHEDMFHMWYLGTSTASRANDIAVGYATSPDGVEWTPHPGNPILTSADLPWGRSWQTPFVLYDDEAGKFKLWFVAAELERDDEGNLVRNDQRLGYATSSDGIAWDVLPRMIYPSGRSPSVIKVGPRQYRMWMGSRPDLNDVVSSEIYANIYEFRSTDGIQWRRGPQPVIRPRAPARSTVYPFVRQSDDAYHMWFGCHLPAGKFEIFCAKSQNGTDWQVDYEQLAFPSAPGKDAFDSRYTSTPCVVQTGNRLLLYYSARDWETEYVDQQGQTRRDGAGVYADIGVAEMTLGAAASADPDEDPACSENPAPQPSEDRSAVIIGAGISGLTAALELGRRGGQVTVVDMSSVFGGHAVMSQGGVSIVDTPVQRAAGKNDSPEVAYQDFIRWGEDADPDWVRYYVDNSRREIFDWLHQLGVHFESVLPAPGNSVDRFHQPAARGIGLVTPIYRECLELDNIRFVWNTKAEQLRVADGRVVGVVTRELRSDRRAELRAGAVILATGGFQSNLDMVRQYWPQEFRFPSKILAGSGRNSVGAGHRLAQQIGAGLVRMDHQWNYFTGIPDFRYPGSNRGLSAANMYGIIVNPQGRRFANLHQWAKEVMPLLLSQDEATLWFVFDESSKSKFVVAGTDWADFDKVDRQILQNTELVKTADTIEQLAVEAGLPPQELVSTIRRYNRLIEQGEDTDFQRFGPNSTEFSNSASPRIETPPYYAMQAYPLTRKSMGGVAIDLTCRVLDKRGQPIPGLYAVGELTGLAGINGKAALEGTFLGPCIVTGRVAARAVAQQLRVSNSAAVTGQSCLECHDIKARLAEPQPGYWHFEKSHAVALERGTDCRQCHAELAPYRPDQHRMSAQVLTTNCVQCHIARE